jgi:hypothetical protein
MNPVFEKLTQVLCHFQYKKLNIAGRRGLGFSHGLCYICADNEYRSQVGALQADRKTSPFVMLLSSLFFHLQIFQIHISSRYFQCHSP